MNRTDTAWFALVVALFVLSGCQDGGPATGTTRPGDIRAQTPEAVRTWPAAPRAARVRYLETIRTAEDLDIKPSALESLANLVFGAQQRRLVRPTDVVVDSTHMYVADMVAQGVHVFDRENDDYRLVRREGNQPIVSPVALAQADDGSVYVTDSARAEILHIRVGAEHADVLPLDFELLQPTGLAFDRQSGHLLVVDTRAHKIDVLTTAGHRIKSMGARGSAGGEFNYPTHLWSGSDGELLVADSLNYRVQRLGPGLTPRSVWGRRGDGSGDIASLKGIASDSQGHIYAVDSLFHAVQIFDGDGRFLLSFGDPGQSPGEFWLPSGIFIDGRDRIYVADAYNARVQVFEYVGANP